MSLAPLIEEYEATGGDEPSEEEVAERALDTALRSLASSRLALRVRGEGPYTLNVWADASPEMPAGFHLSWRLLAQSDDVSGTFPSASTPHEFARLALSEITPFIVATLTDDVGRSAQSILIAEIHNDVPGRADAIVAAHLTESGAFARFIRLMLATPAANGSLGEPAFGSFQNAFGQGVAEDGSGLLELLVRATATNSNALGDIEQVLSHLSPDERAKVLPDGFSEVWRSVIDAARPTRVEADHAG